MGADLAWLVVAGALLGGAWLASRRDDAPGTPAPSALPAGLGALPSGAAPDAPSAPSAVPVHDCEVPDRGLGTARALAGPSGARVHVTDAALRPDGSYDLVLFFHGGRAVERLLLPDARGLVLATIDRGALSSAYAGAYPDRRAVDTLLGELDLAVSRDAGVEAHATRVIVGSWSAGYAAVRDVLTHAGADEALAGVVLVDSLYGSHDAAGRVAPGPLEPFLAAARRALASPRFTFFSTSSQIATTGYASTSEVASFLIEVLRVRADHPAPSGSGLRLRMSARERGFELRDYEGADAAAHCAHLGFVPEAVRRALGG